MTISSSICHLPGPGNAANARALLIIDVYRRLGAFALVAKQLGGLIKAPVRAPAMRYRHTPTALIASRIRFCQPMPSLSGF